MCRITVEDIQFEGLASTKKIAKLNASVTALTHLNDIGLLQQKLAAKSAKKPSAVTVAMAVPAASSKKNTSLLKNALMKLNELRSGLDYRTISEEERIHQGMHAHTFTMSVDIDGQTYLGVGMSKKAARADAAEKVLRALEQWIDEDEQLKQEAAATAALTTRILTPEFGSTGGGKRRGRVHAEAERRSSPCARRISAIPAAA